MGYHQSRDLRWTSSSDGLLSRKRLRVRLWRWAGDAAKETVWGETSIVKAWTGEGELRMLMGEAEEGEEQSSESDRLRLRTMIVRGASTRGRL